MAVSPLALPFEEAIAYFRSKLNIPSERWDQIVAEAHDWAFAVAGVTKGELLEDLRQAIEKALTEGTTLQEFRQDFDEIVEQRGWSYRGGRDWRTAIIFGTNIRVAYAAGRYRQMTEPAVLAARPYWMWRHGDSYQPRPLHQEWDGLILAASDPWWQTHYPPCGFGCRCRVFSLSTTEVERMGREPDQAPNDGFYTWTDSAGNSQMLPKGVDPGWGYAPGASLPEQRKQILQRTLDRLPLRLKREVQDDIS